MRRYKLGAACLAGIALASTAAAQGGGDGVLLRYHFKPGQEFRYRMTVTGDLPITPGGAAATGSILLPAEIPTTMNGTYEWVQRVKSVSPAGAATVSLSVAKMDLTTSVMGMSIVNRLGAGRKMEMLMNGQPFGAGGDTSVPDPLTEVQIDATGKMSGANGESARSMSRLFGGQNVTSIFSGSMPGMGMLVFPEKPVRPGDTWDTTTEIQVSVTPPGPTGSGVGAPPGALVSQTATIHNKLLRVENGRAVIETRVTTTAHPGGKTSLAGGPAVPGGMNMTIDKLNQSATGTTRLNVSQGVIEGGDFDLKVSSLVNLGMPTPTPAAPPAGSAAPDPQAGAQPPASANPPAAAVPPADAPGSMKIGVDGTLKVKLERVATPPAAAPPASHPPQ
jgi:hypothetical protein